MKHNNSIFAVSAILLLIMDIKHIPIAFHYVNYTTTGINTIDDGSSFELYKFKSRFVVAVSHAFTGKNFGVTT